ncbi:hypothetical protein AC579_1090 [Pseudocercospora musae]|uniref:Uncharacterized protein n=1 Tax=Pseudocercospora musae TaxID=113226 RepID=A0A139H8C4_9PEZI|nr:hypothetical protein AC579_1090 [Pseudocercospora musae]
MPRGCLSTGFGLMLWNPAIETPHTTRKDQCAKERPLEKSCAWDREDVRVLQKADNITETPDRPTRGHCQESDLRMNTWSLERSTFLSRDFALTDELVDHFRIEGYHLPTGVLRVRSKLPRKFQ